MGGCEAFCQRSGSDSERSEVVLHPVVRGANRKEKEHGTGD
jgi:hypothetical protein